MRVPLPEMNDLQKRMNEAGIRFLRTELEVAGLRLTGIEESGDAKERMRSLKEVRTTVDLVSRLAANLEMPEAERQEIRNRIEALQERLGAWSSRRLNPVSLPDTGR